MRDPMVCQVTIDAINSESECDKQNVNQPCKSECDEQKANHPCKLRTTTKLLTHVTSADAAIGLWIVVLYTVIGIGEVLHCLKACSQVFYWSALILIMADLAASIGATLLTEFLNTEAKHLEEAGVCVCYLVVPPGYSLEEAGVCVCHLVVPPGYMIGVCVCHLVVPPRYI